MSQLNLSVKIKSLAYCILVDCVSFWLIDGVLYPYQLSMSKEIYYKSTEIGGKSLF